MAPFYGPNDTDDLELSDIADALLAAPKVPRYN